MLLLILVFYSCNNNDNKLKLNNDSIINTKENSSNYITFDSANSSRINFDTSQKNSNQKVMSADELEKILPKSIKGTEKLPSNKGYKNIGGLVLTSASSEYIFKGGGMYIRINDYSNYENIPDIDKAFFKEFPSEDGKSTEKISTKYGNGFLLWDETFKTGFLKILINNRFILEINATKIGRASCRERV